MTALGPEYEGEEYTELEKAIDKLKLECNSYAGALVRSHDQQLSQRFEHIDELLEVHENQLGALTQGYMEATALIQALMAHLMNDSPEKVAEFHEHVRQARQTFMDNLKYAARIAQESTDHFTAHAPDPSEQRKGDQESE